MRSRRSSLSRFSHNPSTPALLLGLGAVFLAACGGTDTPTSSTSPPSDTDVTGVPAANAPHVTSRDETGAPKFMWAARPADARGIAGKPSDIARAHLVNHAEVLGISQNLAKNALLVNEQTLEGGASVLTFGQKLGGVTVFRTRTSVIMDKRNNLVAITGNLRPAAETPAKVGHFTLAPQDALVKAYADRFGLTLPSGAIRETGMESDGEYHDYEVATPAGAARIVADTARVRKVYYPQQGKLVAAYHVEFLARAAGSKRNDGWLYAIAGDDGRTLLKNSTTHSEKFTYRVWAEQGAASQNNIPLDGPLKDSTPLPASASPDIAEGPFVASSLVSVEGFNKNPNGTADPWLAADATETKGNNIDAYTDRNSKDDGTGDGFDQGIDIRANTTAARTFDRTYDATKNPDVTQDQEKAAVTQLFYNTNWLHDYWYDSGFDEKSGNAQVSNYGRGGKEGDPLLAQAQDGADVGLSDNANMNTPSDGKSPRMQMYVWHGNSTHSITATGGATFPDGIADFSFGAPSFNVNAPIVYADVPDGCTAPTNVSGKIALVDRGACGFVVKVKNAQTAGAVAVLIANNAAGGPVQAGGTDATITIGGFGISQADGTALKAKLGAGAVSATIKLEAGVFRDGDIDNTVVAHEWGHYLHHRLVDCGSKQCDGMSEGWADFDALMMVIKAGDNVQGTTFGLAQYASAGGNPASQYFGIRRTPYSTDVAKDPFTFKFIRKAEDVTQIPDTVPVAFTNDNSEVHNVGEIWAEMLFEGYANILAGVTAAPPRFTFEQAKRRMADYLVAGMKATPTEPTFTEQRDAILAVTFAKDKDDFLALAKGFAKRGLGVGAIAPPIDSTDLNEAVEDSSMKGNLKFLDATVSDSIRSCDRDGFLDGDEAGDVLIRVQNSGWVNLQNSTATVTSTAPGVTFPKGTNATIVSLDPYGIAKVRITIALDPATPKQTFIPVTVTLANPDSLKASVTGNIDPRVNYDVAPASSLVDDVEAPTTTWTEVAGAGSAGPAWSRIAKTDAMGAPVAPPDTEWRGADATSGPSDQSLVSPSLDVSTTESFTLTIKHKYAFEMAEATGQAPAYYFDGGLIEISPDNGATWVDISTYADPGYPHTLSTNGQPDDPTNNPLLGRKAFSGTQADVTTLSLDLGTALAGKTVKVRFRVGADANTGLKGWEIDDITFAGITNKPFASLVDDASTCSGVPVPVAGPAQTVHSGDQVSLDASGSSDPNGDPITFQWEELDGPAVTLADPTAAAKTGFVAPPVDGPTKLLFRVTVADAHQAASDTVEITVLPAADAGPGGGGADGGDVGSPGSPAPSKDDGCGCHTVGGTSTSNTGAFATAIAGALAFLARGRRKKK